MQKLMKLAQDLESSKPNEAGSIPSDADSCDSDDDATVVQEEETTDLATYKKQEAFATAALGAAAGGGVDSSGHEEFVPIAKYSRGEKKARRLLMKLDLVPMPNVSRVTMRKAKNVLLCIDRPEVYKCPNTKTLICFGEMRIEDTSNAAAAQAAERYLNDVSIRSHSPSKDADSQQNIEEDDGDGAVDDSQLDEKDIELVQMQAECSRQKAVKALLKHKKDVVNAIMDLTVG
ncbi:hypothetical protein KR044_003039 [Drosophila immigrans]|nr:hypothetical protein KR044_003039 [Drosophila immigrans]